MNPSITAIDAELRALRDQVSVMGLPDTPFNQVWGWQQPSLTRTDLVFRIEQSIQYISRLPESISDPVAVNGLSRIPGEVQWYRGNVLPNLPGGNAYLALPPLIEILERLVRLTDMVVSPFPAPPPPAPTPDWQKLASEGYLPKKLVARLTGMEKRLDQMIPSMEALEGQITAIQEGYDSAEQLPESLASLEEGRRSVATAQTEAQSLAAQAATSAREAAESTVKIQNLARQSEAKFADLDDAYRAAATKGLASSFQNRAEALEWSVRSWVTVLVFALAGGAVVGCLRFEELQSVLRSTQPPAVIWGNLVFSLLSVAPAVWLGWIATKQINQRFRLAEDYGYKATVASAYEAWKTEAKKQDIDFERRLFGSALSRLEEAPLRLMETENYGSPWQELTGSPAFAKALELVPDLKGTLAKIVASAGGAAAGASAVIGAMGARAAATPPGDDEPPSGNTAA